MKPLRWLTVSLTLATAEAPTVLSLNKTDRYFLIDFPIEYEKQIIIKKYRQDLRDFINNNEIKILSGEKVEFPPQPDFIDLNIIY